MAARRFQRGVADMWLVAIGAIVILSLLAGITYAVKSYLDGIDSKAFARGKKETEATYAQRDNNALRAANAKIQELQTAARAKEAEHAAQLNDIAANYRKGQADELAHKDRVIAGLRDGTAKLYVTLAARAESGGRSAGTEAGACAGGTDGVGGSGILAEPDATFLVTEASRADRIAGKLRACQAVIRADRK